jgi:farnesyl diphosphate synthase
MRDDLAWEVWSRERQQRIEHVLAAVLPPVDGPNARLGEAMRYATLGGGKRVRPLLAYAAGEFANADPAVVDAAAAAVELIHAYSLIHDDLPCMDDDALRRGKPTCHVAYGEAPALLAGDALQTLAFAVLGGSTLRDAGKACATLAEASGVAGMAGGQAIDLEAVGRALTLPELEAMHRLKTGALIQAAVRLGAACGRILEVHEMRALDNYAAAAGLAFQVVDDVLDVEGSNASLGKTAGKDAARNKPTYVALLGLDAAKRYAESLRIDAHAAIAPFAARGRRLAELADWITLRQH